MTLTDWLWVIRIETALVFVICLVGNVRAAGYVGRIARKSNRPISKSTMIGLNILLAGSLAAMIVTFRGRAPADHIQVAFSIARNAMWAAMALKTIVTEEIIIRRPEKLFLREEQEKIALEVGCTQAQVNLILRKFLQ